MGASPIVKPHGPKIWSNVGWWLTFRNELVAHIWCPTFKYFGDVSLRKLTGVMVALDEECPSYLYL